MANAQLPEGIVDSETLRNLANGALRLYREDNPAAADESDSEFDVDLMSDSETESISDDNFQHPLMTEQYLMQQSLRAMHAMPHLLAENALQQTLLQSGIAQPVPEQQRLLDSLRHSADRLANRPLMPASVMNRALQVVSQHPELNELQIARMFGIFRHDQRDMLADGIYERDYPRVPEQQLNAALQHLENTPGATAHSVADYFNIQHVSQRNQLDHMQAYLSSGLTTPEELDAVLGLLQASNDDRDGALALMSLAGTPTETIEAEELFAHSRRA